MRKAEQLQKEKSLQSVSSADIPINQTLSKRQRYWKTLIKQRWLVGMVLPACLILLIFHYIPIYGIIIAFKNYRLGFTIANSPWVGFKWFKLFFSIPMGWQIIRNTVIIGGYSILFGFPAPIILALILNEINNQPFKRTVQTLTYLPHFISVVIIVGMLKELASLRGTFNMILMRFGMEPIIFFAQPEWFRTLYIVSGLWQGVGWGSIIYLAALSGVNPELYEVAKIDGANRFQKMLHVSLPSILPVVAILLIFSVGGILGADTFKILLMYNPRTYVVADVIGTFIAREGILEGQRFSYTTAIGLIMSGIAFVFVWTANFIARKVSEYHLW